MGLVSLCPFCVHTTYEGVGQHTELYVIASSPEKRESLCIALRHW